MSSIRFPSSVDAPTAPELKSPLRRLFERRVHRTDAKHKELLWTGANAVTVTRLALTTVVMLVAIAQHSPIGLAAGLLISWALDIADGQLARCRRRETVIGAQFDILADRVTAMWVVLGVVVFDDAELLTVATVAAVWIQLSFFDQLLASQFLRFGHWSPDEFHLEDQGVWRLNWAPAAKVIGNVPLGLLVIGGRWLWLAMALAFLLILVRIFSYWRIAERIELLSRGLAGDQGLVGDVREMPDRSAERSPSAGMLAAIEDVPATPRAAA